MENQTNGKRPRKVIKLTAEQVAEFREAFNMFDIDGGGTISKDELGTVLRSLGQAPTDEDLDQMMAEIVKDDTDEIDFDQFLRLMAGKVQSSLSSEEITEAFRVRQSDRDGYITVESLRAIIDARGTYLTDEGKERLIAVCKPDANGYINYVDLIQSMQALSEY